MKNSYHQHSALLKSFGFKLKKKEIRTNPDNPARKSVTKSIWSNPLFGTILVDHMPHTYTHVSTDDKERRRDRVIGKDNNMLKRYLVQLLSKAHIEKKQELGKYGTMHVPSKCKFCGKEFPARKLREHLPMCPSKPSKRVKHHGLA